MSTNETEFQKELLTIMKSIESKLDVIAQEMVEFKKKTTFKPPSLFDLFNSGKRNGMGEEEDEEDEEDEDDEEDEEDVEDEDEEDEDVDKETTK